MPHAGWTGREGSPSRPGNLTDDISTRRFDHPFFAWVWSIRSARESWALRELRRENLAGFSGRVLEVGAGTGTNFWFYLVPCAIETLSAAQPFDAVVRALVLCIRRYPGV